MAEVTTGALIHIDPRELLADENSRPVDITSPESRDLIASLKQPHGQLQAIAVIKTATGAFRIRFGHRRQACAIEAGLETLRAEVIADESVTPSTEIDRLCQQWEENEARQAYTTGEKAAIVLSLFNEGLTDTAISKRLTGVNRKLVKQARTVAGSEAASEAADSLALTLEQAAALADYDTDPEAFDELLEAAQKGTFEHKLKVLEKEAAEAVEEQEQRAALEAKGYRVVEPGEAKGLWMLGTDDGDDMTDEAHASCPGHVAWAKKAWQSNPPAPMQLVWKTYLGCDRADEFHAGPVEEPLTAEEEAAAKEEKRREQRENKMRRLEWEAATDLRRTWLKTNLLKRRTAPAGTALFIAESLLRGDYAIRKAMQTDYPDGVDLFGVDGKSGKTVSEWSNTRRDDMLTLTSKPGTDSRMMLVALGAILTAYEGQMHKDAYRTSDADRSRYLAFLGQIGHKLTDIEQQTIALAENAEQDV